MTLDRDPSRRQAIPRREEFEAIYKAPIVTFDDNGVERAGGECRCCGADPNPDYQDEPVFIYRAGLCDADGVFFSMLCGDCLEDIRFENDKRNGKRVLTHRDELAREITELMPDDPDGQQTFMDDLP